MVPASANIVMLWSDPSLGSTTSEGYAFAMRNPGDISRLSTTSPHPSYVHGNFGPTERAGFETASKVAKADPTAQLLQHGDALEKCMFADDEFASVFSYYPPIWYEFILPNRLKDNPMQVHSDWEDLAERNYSAVVRCWNAYSARSALVKLCGDFEKDAKVSTILAMHSEAVAFFCCAGGAIENQSKCFDAKPLNCPEAYKRKADAQKGFWSLKRIYDLRTQYVHKIIVPCFPNEGALSLDTSLLADPNLRWKDAKGQSPTEVASVVESVWSDFSRNMNEIWATLYSKLKGLPLMIPPLNFVQLADISERMGETAYSGTRGDQSLLTSGSQTGMQESPSTEEDPEAEE